MMKGVCLCVSYSKSIEVALKECHGRIFFPEKMSPYFFSFAVCILILTVPEKTFALCTVPTDAVAL